MAVQQVSQVQVRRGLLQDLGQLTSGEFGWAVDQLRLFIGNGPVIEGAPYEGITEVMTRKSLLEFYSGSGTAGLPGLFTFPYTFKGSRSGYDVQTGETAINPVTRPLQDKLDDIVNVKDFGALGDGLNDDFSSIDRAIREIYNRRSATTPEITRRVINFYPGVYIITDELRIPPNCVLRAAGKGSVVIRLQGSGTTCMFRTTNSSGNFNNLIATTPDLRPGFVEFEGITFEMTTETNKAIGVIDSATDLVFNRCRFLGSRSLPPSDDMSSCINMSSLYLNTGSVFFNECDFRGTAVGVRINETRRLENIQFTRCTFSQLVKGVTASTTRSRSIMSLKLSHNVFDKIKEHAVFTASNITAVTSSMNTYLDVGTNYTVNMDNLAALPNVTVSSSVIRFGGNVSYSFGDIFLRSSDQEFVLPTVEHAATDVISMDSASGLKLGSRYQTIGRSYLLPTSSINYIPISNRFLSGTIHYSLERLQRYRSGIITYTVDPIGNIVCYRDTYTQAVSTDTIIEMQYSTILGGVRKPMVVVKSLTAGFGISVLTFDIKSQDFKQLTDAGVTGPSLSAPF